MRSETCDSFAHPAISEVDMIRILGRYVIMAKAIGTEKKVER